MCFADRVVYTHHCIYGELDLTSAGDLGYLCICYKWNFGTFNGS
jgi:hypothetical protein